jgi:hypothetical protein
LKENNYNFGTTKKFKESGYAPACETLVPMVKSIVSYCLFLVFTFNVYGQTEKSFYGELTENKFRSITKRKLPSYVIKLLGRSSYRVVGTKMSQTGCVSKKTLVINWAVSSENEMFVIKTSSCGAWTELSYYIISERNLFKIDLKKDCTNFEEFKTEYLKK